MLSPEKHMLRKATFIWAIGIILSSLVSAQDGGTNSTWDVYPVRHLSRPPSLWRFGGFSLPAEVVLMVSLSNHQTQAGPRGGATFAIRQGLDNARLRANGALRRAGKIRGAGSGLFLHLSPNC